MPDITDPPRSPARSRAPARPRAHWLRRVAWFALIWCASVAALGLVAYVIRLAVIPS